MKKLLLTSIALVSFSSAAVFGVYQGSWVENGYKYCKYSNGAIVTVSVSSMCPQTNG